MADELFGRVCRVVVGKPPPDFSTLEPNGIEITDLRTQFKITKTSGKEPNTCEVGITNLARSTRTGLQAKGAKLIISAGYASNIAQIFAGDVRTIDHTRQGAEWLSKIQAGDGERALLYARINESFAAGVKVADVIAKLADALGLDLGNVKDQSALMSAQFVSGYTSFGPASRELDRVLKAQGFVWSVQDGRIQVRKPGAPAVQTVVAIGPESGLIGSPEHGTPGERGKPAALKVKTLLQPTVKPGGRISLTSAQYQGVYVVEKVEHTGDTAGGEWYTSIECHP